MKFAFSIIIFFTGIAGLAQERTGCNNETCLFQIQQQFLKAVEDDNSFQKKYEGVADDGKTYCSMEYIWANRDRSMLRAKVNMGSVFGDYWREIAFFSGQTYLLDAAAISASDPVYAWTGRREINVWTLQKFTLILDQATDRPLQLQKHYITDQFNFISKDKVETCTFKQ